MARKRRNPERTLAPAAAAAAVAPAGAAFVAAAEQAALRLPAESTTGNWTVWILALMMFIAPAAGAPTEELLQDTLKSIIVSFAVLLAALHFFWRLRGQAQPLRWHGAIALPLALLAYALGSTVWSHTYLASVEAIRWFLFSLIVWLGLNTFSRERLPVLFWGIHLGAVVAALWAALQFWGDFTFFPQGPHPASTFVNRNFFAEFAVSTLPFSAVLLARARRSAAIAILAATTGLVIVAILMTGTRAALFAMWLLVLVVLPLAAWRCREEFTMREWSRGMRILAAGVLFATVAGLGSIPSGDPKLLAEGRGTTAIQRGFIRTQSIRPDDVSLGIRQIMWRATLRLIAARPVTGVGAGAWENDIPLYQAEGSQLETDYYAHNEYLQLIAEYGLVGWAFLGFMGWWLLRCAEHTWKPENDAQRADRPWRVAALASLFAFFVVSNVGFPWRMAATGALFAIGLGILAACEARCGLGGMLGARAMRWPARANSMAIGAAVACLALAAYITEQAVECEQKIVRAIKIALMVTASGSPNDPAWQPARHTLLQLIREGIDINPHYRKITPMVADELAKWGDWQNATWIWESVLESRPHVVAILCNVARGYASAGEPQKARDYLARAAAIQPNAPAVRSLEVVLLSRTGHDAEALQLARQSIAQDIYDIDMLNAAFVLGSRAHDVPTAENALALRMRAFPETRALGWIQLGTLYANESHDHAKALGAYRKGFELATAAERNAWEVHVPLEFRAELGLTGPAAPAAAQTSSSKR
ncbi:MAG TPA: O-antigen ligase family protein [Ramlibacter sp.]|uniref:O-antigen ligase family protein n=1 Tax=Ramlibacter sp. TaxID=1917967 RepID=UPI002BE3F1C8|nr:O-antigen ligase family protein [Ramlibacter sp.]HVZ43611.1 O-antigen ligase family protein [Ramlibacter sp.]